MSHVRSDTILALLRNNSNIQPLDVEIDGPTLDSDAKFDTDAVIAGVITAALVLRKYHVVHTDFSLQNFKLHRGIAVLCNFEDVWLADTHDYLPDVQSCIAQLAARPCRFAAAYIVACTAKSLKQVAEICDVPIPKPLQNTYCQGIMSRKRQLIVHELPWLWESKLSVEFLAMLHDETPITDELTAIYQYYIYSRFEQPRVMNYLVGNCANVRAISNDWVWEPKAPQRLSECKFDTWEMFKIVQGITRAWAALEHWRIVHPFTIDCFRIRDGEPILTDFSGAYLQDAPLDRASLHTLINAIVGAKTPIMFAQKRINRPAGKSVWIGYLNKKTKHWHNNIYKFVGRHMSLNINVMHYQWKELRKHITQMYEKPILPQPQ